MTRKTLLLFVFSAAITLASSVSAQTLATRKLVIVTKEAPPFAMKNGDGKWEGISIDLWREIASELKLDCEFREMELGEMLRAVADGTADAGVAAITITAEREKALDFTQPFYTSGLGVAVAKKSSSARWFDIVRGFFSVESLKLFSVLLVMLCVAALAVWLFERKHNAAQFGGKLHHGLGASVWWSAVTMTTVGYGDKAPVTVGGRLAAIIWMFSSVVIVSSFTAHITSQLTVSHLHTSIRRPEDLSRLSVATLAGTTSEEYLRREGIARKVYASANDALQAVAYGEADAFVYDAPILKYLAHHEMNGQVEVLPFTFERQDYGIVLPQGSPLREPINVVLLEKISHSSWKEIQRRYLGE